MHGFRDPCQVHAPGSGLSQGRFRALGRIAVVEYLPTGPQMRKAIARDIPLDDLRDEALRSGLVPMREHALRLVHEGIIAFDELPWLLPPERLAPDPKRTP